MKSFSLKISIGKYFEGNLEFPTMEESIIDSDVLVIDGTVEGESDHHGQVGDLSKAL